MATFNDFLGLLDKKRAEGAKQLNSVQDFGGIVSPVPNQYQPHFGNPIEQLKPTANFLGQKFNQASEGLMQNIPYLGQVYKNSQPKPAVPMDRTINRNTLLQPTATEGAAVRTLRNRQQIPVVPPPQPQTQPQQLAPWILMAIAQLLGQRKK